MRVWIEDVNKKPLAIYLICEWRAVICLCMSLACKSDVDEADIQLFPDSGHTRNQARLKRPCHHHHIHASQSPTSLIELSTRHIGG